MDIDTYFYEQDLVFGYLDFHSDWFSLCSSQEWADICTYYAVDVDTDSYIDWRESVLASDPELALRARMALRKVLDAVGIADQLD